MIDTMVSFYNNLFTVEIAVFGVIAAALFVFLQIVYSQFSYREIYLIFWNILLISYLVLSTITLGLTAFSSLILSFPKLQVMLGNTIYVDVIRNELFASSLLIALFFSLVLFLIFIFSNIKYIRPSKIALMTSRKIRAEHISNYLLKKYGVTAPDTWLYRIRFLEESTSVKEEASVSPESSDNDEKRETPEEHEYISKMQEFEGTLLEKKREYEDTKKRVENSQDPLESLDALMLKAISNSDKGTINEILSALLRISGIFLKKYKYEKERKEWSPYSGILRNYLKYITELVVVHLGMCEKQGLDTVKTKILDTTEEIAKSVIAVSTRDVDVILVFWKDIADKAIGDSRQMFNKVMLMYRSLTEYAFKNGIEDNKDLLDEIFRHLGWLGERLISRQGIEEKTIMIDDHYLSENDQLFETILDCGHKYRYEYPTSYPLIFFDAVYVILIQLMSAYKNNPSAMLKRNIFDCLYIYSSFAEAAIPKENSRGAALAVMRLIECYKKIMSEGIDEKAEEAIGLLVRIGAIAYRHKDKLGGVEFMIKPIDEEIIDLAEKSPYRDKVASEVREAHIHLDADWNFIVEMGSRLQTNFGFMFDWTTGELYPKDDPRRK